MVTGSARPACERPLLGLKPRSAAPPPTRALSFCPGAALFQGWHLGKVISPFRSGPPTPRSRLCSQTPQGWAREAAAQQACRGVRVTGAGEQAPCCAPPEVLARPLSRGEPGTHVRSACQRSLIPAASLGWGQAHTLTPHTCTQSTHRHMCMHALYTQPHARTHFTHRDTHREHSTHRHTRTHFTGTHA